MPTPVLTVVSDRYRLTCLLIAKNASSTLRAEFGRDPFVARRVQQRGLVADLDLDPTGIPAIVNEARIIVPPDGTVTDFDDRRGNSMHEVTIVSGEDDRAFVGEQRLGEGLGILDHPTLVVAKCGL